MRFMLYETKADKILLSKEIEYISKYIALQKIRTANENYVHFAVTGTTGGKFIAPIVFTPFKQHSSIPQLLECQLNEDGYINVVPAQKASMSGVFACGVSITRVRTVANFVTLGTKAGRMLNKELLEYGF